MPAETVNLMKQLTADIKEPKEKARAIYEIHAEKNALYKRSDRHWRVSSPFPASEVDKLNYGDCKALVNYMQRHCWLR